MTPPADTIKHWCVDGKLPGAEKHGRDWSIPQADLDRLIEGRKTNMKAIEIKLETGIFYIPLAAWDNGEVLLPMDGGHRVIDPPTFRACWDAWVSELVHTDDILTRDELNARYPGIAIDHEG